MEKTNQIKVYIDPDNSGLGDITYTMNNMNPPKGVFVTTYYYRNDDIGKQQDATWTKTDIYKKGILHYLKTTESPEFSGWKVIVYLDFHTLKTPITLDKESINYSMHLTEWNEIAKHQNVIFGVVRWPEYSVGTGDGTTMDNAMLRAFRMKALCDFPDIPVFVRDADTLFENILKIRTIYNEITTWEATLKKELERIYKETPSRIIVATQPNYNRQWHVHPVTGDKTVGCYAAITSTLGGVEECVNGSLWKACLKYLRSTSKITNPSGNKLSPSNSGAPTYIGKDEQLLSYVFIPMIFDKIYFYYLEYIQVEGIKVITTETTPFAQTLIEKGITRYPSPYMISRGESYEPLDSTIGFKRKDENKMTEYTILNPASIPLALSKETHELMQTIFKYYLSNRRISGGRP
jgi:hypothetical protein